MFFLREFHSHIFSCEFHVGVNSCENHLIENYNVAILPVYDLILMFLILRGVEYMLLIVMLRVVVVVVAS